MFFYFDFQSVVCTSVVRSFAGCHKFHLFVVQWSQICLRFFHCPQQTDTLLLLYFTEKKRITLTVYKKWQFLGKSWKKKMRKSCKKRRSSSVWRKILLSNIISLFYKTNWLIRIILSQFYALSQQDFFLMELLDKCIRFVEL